MCSYMKRSRSFTSFKDLDGLKQSLKARKEPPQKKAPLRKTRDEKTDEELFAEAMSDVREIREFRNIPFKSPLCIKTGPPKEKDDFEILCEVVRGAGEIRLSDTGEYMEWARPGLRRGITRKLHRGDFAVQESIDLHGMTLVEAEEALKDFFSDALRRNLFCVKIIHGRGLRSPNGPVLKEALKGWLHGRYGKCVLAYASAKSCDGGLGATYIILKSR